MSPENHIPVNNDCDFGHLIASASGGNEDSLSRLAFVLTAMLNTWARRERQEIRWIASDGKCMDHPSLVKTIIEKYLKVYAQNKAIPSFGSFMEYAIREFRELVQAGFMQFLQLLRQNNQQAWKIVYEDLQERSAAWFYKKNHSLNGKEHSIFTLSVEIIYTKFMDNAIFAGDAVAFKSYFFRILENKVHEAFKDPFSKRSVPIEEVHIKSLFHFDTDSSVEEDERVKILVRALGILNPEESQILNEYYFGEKNLKTIAQETNQTEENIRIKKFRALKKLNKYLQKAGYGS